MGNTITINNLPFSKTTLDEAVYTIYQQVNSGLRGLNIYTVNVDLLVLASKDAEYHSLLRNTGRIVADGAPIVWLSRMLGDPLPERVAGSDVVESLFSRLWTPPLKVYLLGGAPGVASIAADKIHTNFPSVHVVGVSSPTRQAILDFDASQSIVDEVNRSEADVLLVGLGAPIQERWLALHGPRLETKVNIGCGATIDFLAGKFPRAPILFRKLGVEWAFRLMLEPRRLWKRYLVRDLAFFNIAVRALLLNGRR